MRVKMYNLMSDLVERGVKRGYARAFKHTDNPLQTMIEETIHQHIMEELCEYFDFFDENTERPF